MTLAARIITKLSHIWPVVAVWIGNKFVWQEPLQAYPVTPASSLLAAEKQLRDNGFTVPNPDVYWRRVQLVHEKVAYLRSISQI